MDKFMVFCRDIGILLIIIAAELALAVAATLIAHRILLKLLERLCTRSPHIPPGSFTEHCRKPLRWSLITIAVYLLAPALPVPAALMHRITQILGLLLIALLSWLLIRLTYVFDDFIVHRFDITDKDNLNARKVHTQLQVLKRIIIVVVAVIAAGTMLMTFDSVRQLGTAILASAGIIGLVVGIAAQKTIGTFIAGLQIAFTQPIRVDDVVIVENEWGRIEEITLTYVVVKIWDLRRLIVPITYFIEKPFQNWTRTSADILGSVFIYTDYTVPVDEIRKELQQILETSPEWDRKVCVLQVTNTSEKAVELRALISAADASAAWNLRCSVREKLLAFVQQKYPDALPRLRVDLDKPPKTKRSSR